MTFLRRAALAPLVALVATLAACGSTPGGTDGLTVTDAWVKAADSGMTGAFGMLVNDTDNDITITAASSDVARMELHEMAMNDAGEMVMRPKEGGFVVPAHGTHELAPGGDHIMFMDLTTALQPGDEVTVTLTTSDGETYTFDAAVRTFTGADENYEGSDTNGDMSTDMSTDGATDMSTDGATDS
ncbi:copper chaperone PCu(A)C [Actinotalea sp. M2MS4P-6]|uniref:copper chaperone PCu(A)C n=1 Tax=Actinotalea sp. M2MS4P-6 TaxID=2983762 RepID=UPI0021E405C8|nr:copper chaperone PCu(A)C [Actinotalea sp. M2MS4P-6]MCV2396296.1 copper chaperone PCu(A)C [Actinotalea sp. M2MS4P-6]